MTPHGEHLKEDTRASLSPQDSGSVTQRIRLRGFSSFTDGDQHWCCLWEKRPRREGGLQPHGLPRHGEAAERRDHRAQRADQHQAVRLLLPHHQRERPVSGRGPERTQITAKVGLRRAFGDPTQVHVPAQPGPAALPGAARSRTPELPLGRRAVLFLFNRRAVQPVRPVVRTCGELHVCYYYHAWVCSTGPVCHHDKCFTSVIFKLLMADRLLPLPLVHISSPLWWYSSSKKVWPPVSAVQLCGNTAGCGSPHLHGHLVRYKRESWQQTHLQGPVQSCMC